jgi:hypothetical protein
MPEVDKLLQNTTVAVLQNKDGIGEETR